MAWSTLTARSAGDAILASDQNITAANFVELAPFFSAWTSWTPTLAQGASTNIAKTILYAKSVKIGRVVLANFRINITAAGTAGSDFTMTLPYTATATANLVIGHGFYFDSGVARYAGSWELNSAGTAVSISGDWSGGASWGSTPNVAAANGDVCSGLLMYEAAS